MNRPSAQWASVFAEAGLGVSKTIGDLAGPCAFAVLMGLARVFYAKFSEKVALAPFMLLSSILCIVSYLLAALSPWPIFGLVGCALCGLSVGIMWPGTFSISAKEIRREAPPCSPCWLWPGIWGCSAGPTLVGFVSGAFEDNLKVGLLSAIVFPVLLIICLGLFALHKKKSPTAE